MTADHFFTNARNDVVQCESIELRRDLTVEHHLQQQITEFIFKCDQIVTFNRVGHFIGFFDGIRCDGCKRLLNVPRTAAFGVTQLYHDLFERLNIRKGAIGFHDIKVR